MSASYVKHFSSWILFCASSHLHNNKHNQHMACACLVRLWDHTKGNWRWSSVMDRSKLSQHICFGLLRCHDCTTCSQHTHTHTYTHTYSQLVEPTHCFRILKKYYKAAVEHIALKAEDELDNSRATEGNTTKGLHCDY